MLDFDKIPSYQSKGIITLIGPCRFKKEFEEVYNELSLKGYVVLLPVFCDDTKDRVLMGVHRVKIDMSSIVIIMNVDGYYGCETFEERDYAMEHGKDILYYTDINKRRI